MPMPAMAHNICRLRELVPAVRKDGYVVHLGSTVLPVIEGVKAIPFQLL